MNKKLFKYLIVGFGNIGHKRQVALGKKAIATLDPNPNSHADFFSPNQIDQKTLSKFNAVVITVPRREKIEAVKYWLKKGKHVLVEKPMVLTPQEAKKLQSLARKNKVIWYTAYNYRFEPHIVKIKKLIDSGFLGDHYSTHMVYGFGNVRQLIGTWRETGFGALDEVGCHLVDLVHYLLGYRADQFEALYLQKTEAKTFDHCVLTTKDKKVLMEASWIMWKNIFSIDIYGSKGSLHMSGLCKWGESILLVRTRILPAGIPEEKKFVASGPPDPTWKEDIKYFESIIKERKTSLNTDLFITQSLLKIITNYTKMSNKQAINKLLETKYV